MSRIFKNMIPYWKSCVIIILLLLMQAACDLALPGYTSAIIDTGIQNGGISHTCPEAITAEDYRNASILMTDYEKEIWSQIYDLDGDIYRLNVKSEKKLDEYDEIFNLPLIIMSQVSEDDLAKVKAMSSMSTINESIAAVRSMAEEKLEAVGSTMVQSMGIAYAKKMDEKAGVDMDKLQTDYLWMSGAKMVAMALLVAAATVFVGLMASRVAASVGRDMRRNVYAKVMGFSNAEMDKFSTASLITRTTNDIQQVQFVTVMLLRVVAYAPILGVGGILKVMQSGANMEWIIALAVVVIMAVVAVLMSITMPKFKRMQELVDGVNLVSREILTGIPVIRAFGREKKEEERFDGANRALTSNMLFTNRVMTFMMPLMTFIMYGLNVLIIWVSAHRIDEGTLQVGEMTAFITYSMQIVMSFLMITMMSVMLPRAGVAANRIQEVLDEKSQIADPVKPEKIDDKKGVVRFNHVHFRYENADSDVLEDIDFTAEPGKTTAIVGSTGCGKSTLVNLIPRLYDVTEGSVEVDGHDIRNVEMSELRSMIGFVPQKAVLFSGTIASNIKFGNDAATDAEMKSAAEIAQAVEFIDEKKEKYDSAIAQGGSNVSGGQKQRLSIARAIAKSPKIYVFDDSFSALDLKTDAALRRELAGKVSDATVIIVAQRISTVMNADQIIVLDDGRVVGKGTHGELMKNCQVYSEIAHSQLSARELGEGA
jgi:ATP-binding cassette subfamily B protein